MVRRNVELKQLTTQHIGSEDVVVDIMTKALGAVKSTHFRRDLKVLPIISKDSEANAVQTTDNEVSASPTTDEARPQTLRLNAMTRNQQLQLVTAVTCAERAELPALTSCRWATARNTAKPT
jgi:hypothetical protein